MESRFAYVDILFFCIILKVIDATDNMDLSWDIDVLTYLISYII